MPSQTPSAKTNSGIQRLSNGAAVIPSSTRPDGSVRKEIRVKPGYKPPEDVEVYKNRTAEAWKNRGKGGVPGAEKVEKAAPAGTTTKKRSRGTKKKSDAPDEDAVDDVQGGVNGEQVEESKDVEEVDPEAEKAKEARKLAKKLRQARELQEKKQQGANLLPEQLEKVIKINELVRQLDGLGFDMEGEKKDKKAEGDAVRVATNDGG